MTSTGGPQGQPPGEPPAPADSTVGFRATTDSPSFPTFGSFSAGLAPDAWLDWSAAARSKNRPLEKLSLAAGKVVWLPHLVGDEHTLVVKRRQGARELPAANLNLDLRPDFVLEHPLGLYVLAQGFLFQFQTADATNPWGVKKCLVRRIDPGTEPVSGSLRRAADGSLWMRVSGGPATLEATDGRPVEAPAGDSLWKVDAEGRFLELRAQGPVGALNQLVLGTNGSYFLRVARNDPGATEPRHGYRPLSSFEFLKNPIPPAVNGVNPSNRELILLLPGRDDRPEQYLLLEAEMKTGKILWHALDLESSVLFPTGDKQTLAQGLTQPALLDLADGSAAVFGLQSRGSTPERRWMLAGRALDNAAKAPVGDPGAVSVAKLGPLPLAKMVASAQPLEAARAWAEARSRIDKRMSALQATPPPLVAELRKLAHSPDTGDSAHCKIVSLLVACGDAESLKTIQFLAEEGTTPVRVQSLEALGRLAGPQDQSIYQTMLNGMADPEPLIKAAAALSLARVRFPGSANTLAAALSFDTDSESDWQKTLGYALRLLGTPGHDRVWQMAQSGQAADVERAVVYFAATAEKAAASSILQLLDYPHLAKEQRRLLVRALRPEGDRELGEQIGKRIVRAGAFEAQELALWWEKAEATPWAGSGAARDRLLEMLASQSEEERWFALGRLKKQALMDAADLLDKGRARFPLSAPQQRALDEAIAFQRANEKPRNSEKK